VSVIHHYGLAEDIIREIFIDQKDIILHFWVTVKVILNEIQQIWPSVVHVQIQENKCVY